MLRKSFVLAIAVMLAAAANVPLSATSDEIILWGGPGSVTINGQLAPPGTWICIGVGPAPQEFPFCEEVRNNGTWRISFPADWQRVHLYVDGFRVPTGPFDESVIGVRHETRLDVGADTDPEPLFLVFHAKRSDVTLFGKPVSNNAWLCAWVDGRRAGCKSVWSSPITTYQFAPGSRNISFTIDGFPVLGASYDALPKSAPFWITLHAGDPERPPFRLYGNRGDVIGPISGCGPRDHIYVHALTLDGWRMHTRPSPDGSWSIDAPSGTTDIRIYASRSLTATARDVPVGAPRVNAIPRGGSREIKLDYRASGWYILPIASWTAIKSRAATTQRFLVGLVVGRWENHLDWAWFAASEAFAGPGVWLTSLPRPARETPQWLALPDLAENPVATPCSTRIHLPPNQLAMSRLALFLELSEHSLPFPQWASILRRFLVLWLLDEHHLLHR